jgi:hypothetical protein
LDSLAGGLGAAVLAALLPAAAAADSAAFRFVWQGGGDWSMRGAIAFDAALLGGPWVLEDQVQCFFIEGYEGDRPVGRWALGMLNEETTWTLTFDPAAGHFVIYSLDSFMPQAWNMDGAGRDCGDPGFGFNIGNAAQDLCLDGELVEASQVPPDRPFPAVRDDAVRFPADACRGHALLSRLEPLRETGAAPAAP